MVGFMFNQEMVLGINTFIQKIEKGNDIFIQEIKSAITLNHKHPLRTLTMFDIVHRMECQKTRRILDNCKYKWELLSVT